MQDLHSVLQIQPRKHVLDGAEYTGPTRQHELDHTRSGDRSALSGVDHEAGTDDAISPRCGLVGSSAGWNKYCRRKCQKHDLLDPKPLRSVQRCDTTPTPTCYRVVRTVRRCVGESWGAVGTYCGPFCGTP